MGPASERAKERNQRHGKKRRSNARRKERSERNLPKAALLPKIDEASGGCFELAVSFDSKAAANPKDNEPRGAEEGWEGELRPRLRNLFDGATWAHVFSRHICAERTITRLPPEARKHLKRLGHVDGRILRFQLSSR